MLCLVYFCFFFFKQKTAYDMRISDWSSDVCSSDLRARTAAIDRCGAPGVDAEHARRRAVGQYRVARGDDEQIALRDAAVAIDIAAIRLRLRIDASARVEEDVPARAEAARQTVGREDRDRPRHVGVVRSEEHTTELQALMRI